MFWISRLGQRWDEFGRTERRAPNAKSLVGGASEGKTCVSLPWSLPGRQVPIQSSPGLQRRLPNSFSSQSIWASFASVSIPMPRVVLRVHALDPEGAAGCQNGMCPTDTPHSGIMAYRRGGFAFRAANSIMVGGVVEGRRGPQLGRINRRHLVAMWRIPRATRGPRSTPMGLCSRHLARRLVAQHHQRHPPFIVRRWTTPPKQRASLPRQMALGRRLQKRADQTSEQLWQAKALDQRAPWAGSSTGSKSLGKGARKPL